MDAEVMLPPYAIAERRYYCPVQLTIEALAGKWKPMIVWHLVLHDKMRYGEIKLSLRTVTHKMLTQSENGYTMFHGKPVCKCRMVLCSTGLVPPLNDSAAQTALWGRTLRTR